MLDRLVDRYLRDVALAPVPLYPHQHAYQAGKLVETALHQLVVWDEKALDQQETALGVFLDTEGHLTIPADTMCYALVRHGSECTIVRWIEATLEGHIVVATLNRTSVRLTIARGCPRVCVCVLSPLLWCLVVNNLLARLSGGGRFVRGYADM